MQVPANNNPRLLRLPDVLGRVGMSRTSLYESVGAGAFPAPIPIGVRSVAWLESEVSAWIQARVERRDKQQSNEG